MRANPITTRFHDRPLQSNIPASVACILFTLIAAALGVLYGDFPAKVSHAPAAPPAPAPVQVQVEARIPTLGQDKNGRSLPFTVYVLAAQLSWRMESTDGLEGGNTLLSPALTAALNHAAEVFCVGTASFEGGTRIEEARAGQRARQLEQWVETAVTNTQIRVFALNAGQYKGPAELVSSDQRKAVILITGPHDGAVDLSQALRSGLERIRQTSPVVNSLLEDYSRSNEWLRHLSKRPLPRPLFPPRV
jgi:hypothetical protein